MSDVPEGYRMSEVGVIPEDWEVKTLGNIFTFGGGYSASRDQLSSDGHCYLHYGDIHKSTKSFIDVRAEYPEIPKLNIPLKRVSPKSLLRNGDVVFVDASEDDEGTSKHIVVVNNEDITYISGLHTIVAKSKEAVLDNGYKRYCFQSRYIKQQFYFYAVGTKVSGISKTNIAKLQLPIPLLPEQQAIASALSDVDGLITALEQLITKKRNIKQGAMQQLLTGEKRLPGFGGEWEVKTLENITTEIGDGIHSTPQYVLYSDFFFVNGNNLIDNSIKITDNTMCVSEIEYNRHKKKLNLRTILLSINGTIGNIAFFNDEKVILGKSAAYINVNNSVSRSFIFYLLQSSSIKNYFEDELTGSTIRNLSLKTIRNTPILLPALPEQQAIAQILSDIDTEVESLEQKQDKYKAIKQGMMQELLTGKTRLV